MIAPAADEQHLCVTCGICCGGALFDYGPVAPDEVAGLRDHGIAVLIEDDQASFPIPCGHLCGTLCQVYESRPRTCRNYRCTTLKALESGEIDRSEADRRVASTKAAVTQARGRLLPGETFLALRERFGNLPSPAPDFQLAMVMLDLTLDRFMRRPSQRVLSQAYGAAEAPAR